MNSIAKQALARAMGTAVLAAPKPKAHSFADLIANLPPVLPVIKISGPINSVMRNEGRRDALDVVRSAGDEIHDARVAEKIIGRLTVTAAEKPGSYARGIVDVIEALRGGV